MAELGLLEPKGSYEAGEKVMLGAYSYYWESLKLTVQPWSTVSIAMAAES